MHITHENVYPLIVMSKTRQCYIKHPNLILHTTFGEMFSRIIYLWTGNTLVCTTISVYGLIIKAFSNYRWKCPCLFEYTAGDWDPITSGHWRRMWRGILVPGRSVLSDQNQLETGPKWRLGGWWQWIVCGRAQVPSAWCPQSPLQHPCTHWCFNMRLLFSTAEDTDHSLLFLPSFCLQYQDISFYHIY